jgi:hypothetical protein
MTRVRYDGLLYVLGSAFHGHWALLPWNADLTVENTDGIYRFDAE